LAIAFCYLLFHPGPHIAILANVPATLLLLWSVYLLGSDLAGVRAARWACLLTVLTPYLIWLSRETVLDYWLAAWVAAGLVALRKTRKFQSHSWSVFFGLVCALGLLTKWFFPAFLIAPVLCVFLESRMWRDRERLLHCADASLVAGALAGIWYLPNLPNLVRYFFENAQIGALEGEPPVFSFQSLIYYLRLLEGYQLFGILFLVVALSCVYAWKRGLIRDRGFLVATVLGGYLAMSLLRTKDPRFTMPLLGPLLIVAGAWLQSWTGGWWARGLKACLVLVLCAQAYAANFGLRWLPEEVVLMRGYTGDVRWDWNLYLQHYFHITGPPKREDWKQWEILKQVAGDAQSRAVQPALALIPDLPRFNAANFNLMARLRGLPVRAGSLRSEPKGVLAFDGYNYVVMTERDQGIAWTTTRNRALNQIIMDNPQTFLPLGIFPLPDGNRARLYAVNRAKNGVG
jgi:hypothetical protein